MPAKLPQGAEPWQGLEARYQELLVRLHDELTCTTDAGATTAPGGGAARSSWPLIAPSFAHPTSTCLAELAPNCLRADDLIVAEPAEPLLSDSDLTDDEERQRTQDAGMKRRAAAEVTSGDPSTAGGAPTAPPTGVHCPFCSSGGCTQRKRRRARRVDVKMGRWWRSYGYAGPAYCQRCSEVFRDHIMRQLSNSAGCRRDSGCSVCAQVLEHFDEPTGGGDKMQRYDEKVLATGGKKAQQLCIAAADKQVPGGVIGESSSYSVVADNSGAEHQIHA